jgi:PST family polysaccharide transporter
MRSVLWVLVTLLAGRLVSVAGLAVLARWLAPADFGLLAFALVYITYVETVGDLGAGVALIYWPSRREDAAQVAFALNVGTGLIWFALTRAAAPAVAAFFGNPAGVAILQALAWTFPLKALGNTHDALCQKELRFKARVVPELGLAATKAVVSVALAAGGSGVWSLVWGQLAGTALWTALLWRVVDWRPRWRWPGGLLAPMLSYGRGIVAVNVLAAVVHHADLVVVGRMLGPTALGLYHVASKVPEMTITMVMWAVSRVLFPALARARTEGREAAQTYLSALRYSSLLTVPAAAALALLAEPLVLVLFGPRWTAAAPVLRALAIAAGLRSMGTQAGDVLKAAGRPGLLAALGALRAVLLVPAMILAAPGGPTAVATVMAAVTGVTMLLNVAAASRLAHVPLRDVASAIRGSLLAAGLLGLGLWAWTAVMGPARQPLALALTLAVGAAGYLAALRVAGPEVFARLLPGGILVGAGGPEYGVAGRFLVPLEAGPLRHFQRTLLVPYQTRERLAHRLPLALGAQLLIARARRPAPAAEKLAAALARPGSPLLRGTPLEGRAGLRAIVAHDAPEAGRDRLVAFIFEEGDRRPTAVLKARALDAAGRSLRNEWNALRRAAGLPPPLAQTVPAALAYQENVGMELLLQGWIPGRSAYAEMHSSAWPWPGARLRRHFEGAARWLARFHVATRTDDGAAAAPGDRRRSAGHGDFWARNTLWHDGRLRGVVDWECSREQAPPGEDLFHFPLTYGLGYPWSRKGDTPPEEAFRLTFVADNPVSRAVGHYFRAYCAEAGLAVAALPSMFATYLSTCWARRPGPEASSGPRLQDMLAESGPSVFSALAADGNRGLKPAQA